VTKIELNLHIKMNSFLAKIKVMNKRVTELEKKVEKLEHPMRTMTGVDVAELVPKADMTVKVRLCNINGCSNITDGNMMYFCDYHLKGALCRSKDCIDSPCFKGSIWCNFHFEHKEARK